MAVGLPRHRPSGSTKERNGPPEVSPSRDRSCDLWLEFIRDLPADRIDQVIERQTAIEPPSLGSPASPPLQRGQQDDAHVTPAINRDFSIQRRRRLLPQRRQVVHAEV